MKKLKAVVTREDGTTKEVYVVVDEQTAEMLAKVEDKQIVNDYLVEEYKLFMADYREKRHTQSLDKSLENGFDIADEKQDLFASMVGQIESEEIQNAIKKLDEEQQWIVQAVFFEGKKQIEIARELHITKQAMSQRMAVIKEQLKKFLKNFSF